MPELTCTGKEACHICGSTDYREAHFKTGWLICLACWREIGASKGNRRPRQQTLNLAQAAQPQEARHG